MMPLMPHAPIARNHTAITGPKNRPTFAVPWRCTVNSATMITAVIGTIHSSRSAVMTLTPSIDDSTEMAGVIMLSPKNSEAPNRPNPARIAAVRRPRVAEPCLSIVMSAMMPPSPSLSARITSVM